MVSITRVGSSTIIKNTDNGFNAVIHSQIDYKIQGDSVTIEYNEHEVTFKLKDITLASEADLSALGLADIRTELDVVFPVVTPAPTIPTLQQVVDEAGDNEDVVITGHVLRSDSNIQVRQQAPHSDTIETSDLGANKLSFIKTLGEDTGITNLIPSATTETYDQILPAKSGTIAMLDDIVTDAQSDWNELDNTQVDYIKNKPTIPAAQIQADWNQTDNTLADYIKNKPGGGGGASSLQDTTAIGNTTNLGILQSDLIIAGTTAKVNHGHGDIDYNFTTSADASFFLVDNIYILCIGGIESYKANVSTITDMGGGVTKITFVSPTALDTLPGGEVPEHTDGVEKPLVVAAKSLIRKDWAIENLSFIPVVLTYAQAQTLAANSGVKENQAYHILPQRGDPNRKDHEGILLKGSADPKKFLLEGSAAFLKPDYQNIGDYSGVATVTGIAKGNNMKLFLSNYFYFNINYDTLAGGTFSVGDIITGTNGATGKIFLDDGVTYMLFNRRNDTDFFIGDTVSNGLGVTAHINNVGGSEPHIGDIQFYNGLHYQLIAYLTDQRTPADNTDAYTVLPTTAANVGYIKEWDLVEFDFDNNWFQRIADRIGNDIFMDFISWQTWGNTGDVNPFINYQWGNNFMYGNKSRNIPISVLNRVSAFNRKECSPAFSSIPENVNCDTALSGGLLTLPKYAGIINLQSSNSTETITEITNNTIYYELTIFGDGVAVTFDDGYGSFKFPFPSHSCFIKQNGLDFIKLRPCNIGFIQVAGEQF